jgi:hypothetical protein
MAQREARRCIPCAYPVNPWSCPLFPIQETLDDEVDQVSLGLGRFQRASDHMSQSDALAFSEATNEAALEFSPRRCRELGSPARDHWDRLAMRKASPYPAPKMTQGQTTVGERCVTVRSRNDPSVPAVGRQSSARIDDETRDIAVPGRPCRRLRRMLRHADRLRLDLKGKGPAGGRQRGKVMSQHGYRRLRSNVED